MPVFGPGSAVSGKPPAQDRFQITFEVEGIKQLDQELGIMAGNIKDLRPAWQDIDKDFTEGESGIFGNEGAYDGWARWKAIDPAYASWKTAHGFDSKILHRTGRLRMSLTNRHSQDHEFKMTRMNMVMGTKVPYAAYHQRGTKHLPKREPIRVGTAQRRRWVAIINKHVHETGQKRRLSIF